MTEQDSTRSIDDEGAQESPQGPAGGDGGRSSYGPAPTVGGEQEPGGPVPPYEGRQTSGEVDEGGTHRDGANVGGATGPRTTDGLSNPDPSDTPGGRAASPSDEMPATDEGEPMEDPGVGPAHVTGTPRGEDSGA